MSDTYQEALSAFQAATDQPTQSSTVETSPAEPSAQPEQVIPPSSQIDLSGLTEEQRLYLQAREREMQSHWTKKWQEAAELRRQAEDALQFIEALNTDPNFAAAVVQRLSENLGLANEAPETPSEEESYLEEEDPYRRELEDLKRWRDEWEYELAVAKAETDIDRQLADLKQQYPHWGDNEIRAVLHLGFSTGGDLYQAANILHETINQAMQSYMQNKSSVQAPSVLPSTAGSPAPEDVTKASDKEVRDLVMQRLLASLGS